MFGIPVYVAQCFMTMCVSALALTSLDAVARIGRMSFQELFSVDDMEHAEGWRKLLCNKYFSTVVTLACGFILTKIGYSNIWPLFGSANQLLSALVLITLCVFLKVTGRENKTLFPPLHHHAVRYLYRTGRENHRSGTRFWRRNRSLHGRGTAADHCNPADRPWTDRPDQRPAFLLRQRPRNSEKAA